MKRLRTFALLTLAATSLSACLSEGIDQDSTDGIMVITHTTRGTVYWQ